MLRKQLWIWLIVSLLLVTGCGPPAQPTPSTPAEATAAPSEVTPTPVMILPTPTPLPPPPTPTPIPIPTEEKRERSLMVTIPAGEFTMGNDQGREEERPAHTVFVDAFEMDLFEVTNEDFAKFVDETGYVTEAEKAADGATWRTRGEGKERHPVVEVSWSDAVAYCQWLGKRLPTEAEWEKAARGTEGLIYPWGNEWVPSKANTKDSGLRGTTVVGSFAESISPYGLFDMAGNVWEWTSDWYEAYPGSDFQSEYFGQKYKVIRGGGWFAESDRVRTTYRSCTSVEATNDNLGFRCAR
jgi:formylglycine-generating enzyme required for sulfatase activity